MLNNIHGRRFARKDNETNPGATTYCGPCLFCGDILDDAKPTLRKKPDVVIVHCGTNDLTSQEKTIENLQELIRLAKTESQHTELVMSRIITRRDKPGLHLRPCRHYETLIIIILTGLN